MKQHEASFHTIAKIAATDSNRRNIVVMTGRFSTGKRQDKAVWKLK
ncbi:MAG: hypothetical protein LBH82_03540 [Bacteroidales bacterium]|jgi:hypothetical protein|nr:hypothetical protein [Bacteroidales bacterium]